MPYLAVLHIAERIRFQYRNVDYYAHRYMCALVHGEVPEGHETAHSCGRRNCCTPKHLSWKTRSGNQLDRREHGTRNNAWWGMYGKLSPGEVEEIKSLKGYLTQREIGAMFGVTFQTISNIHRGKSRVPWSGSHIQESYWS